MIKHVDPLKQIDEHSIHLDFEHALLQREIEEFERVKDLIPNKMSTVCLHWLRGLCHKTEYTCDRLHIYDEEFLPICQFFVKGECNNSDCIFLHPTHERVDLYCIAYAKGFCAKGPSCAEYHDKFPESDIHRIPTHVKNAQETHRMARKKGEKYKHSAKHIEQFFYDRQENFKKTVFCEKNNGKKRRRKN